MIYLKASNKAGCQLVRSCLIVFLHLRFQIAVYLLILSGDLVHFLEKSYLLHYLCLSCKDGLPTRHGRYVPGGPQHDRKKKKTISGIMFSFNFKNVLYVLQQPTF